LYVIRHRRSDRIGKAGLHRRKNRGNSNQGKNEVSHLTSSVLGKSMHAIYLDMGVTFVRCVTFKKIKNRGKQRQNLDDLDIRMRDSPATSTSTVPRHMARIGAGP
jgi:hypothetical protein